MMLNKTEKIVQPISYYQAGRKQMYSSDTGSKDSQISKQYF